MSSTVGNQKVMDLSANEEISGEQFQAHVVTCNYAMSFLNSMSLKCAIELGIPDILRKHGRPMSLPDLVTALQFPPNRTDGMRRLMRVLVHSGFFAQVREQESEEEDYYALTQVSRLFLKDAPLTTLPFSLLNLHQLSFSSFSSLSKWFRTSSDATSFETAHGEPLWDATARYPDYNNAFKEAMALDSRITANFVVNEGKEVFEGLGSLVDVGGGTGTMAKAIAEAFPLIRCTVLDLPHVVAGLKGTANLNYVGGDMFEGIPSADAVLLKLILHDWNDEDCIKILSRCKEAIKNKAGGKIIIIDMVIGSKNEDKELTCFKLYSDMRMMSYHNGKERDMKEWEKILWAAGLRNYKIRPMPWVPSLIEVYST